MKRVAVAADRVVRARFPSRYGEFYLYGFVNEVNGEEAVALVKGTPPLPLNAIVRIHSQCLTGDTFHSLRCDCGEQLEQALRVIADAGAGVLIYQMQEGRGIGLINKIRAYELQDEGVDTVDANLQLGFEADLRNYEFPAEILKYLGIRSARLMSNNPDKIRALEEAGVEVTERVPLIIQSSPFCRDYLQTKRDKLGHLL
jgi:3,4-dihydroxy 2-butanone 4-phosphate synthase / GTP cyclohydrolase II